MAYTREDYENAVATIAACIEQDLTEMAQNMWDDDPDMSEEYESFDEYRKSWINDVMECDESPAGYDLMNDIITRVVGEDE